MSTPDYFAADAPDSEEQLRLQGLEMLWDPVTRRRLLEAGLGEGQRCLELGAGRGSVARMMAECTDTRVIAVDRDPRYLDPTDQRYEIRKVDVTNEPSLTGEQFDVIHFRFLLMHLPDPLTVVKTLARCLTPAGFLLAEEPNMLTWAAADGTEPGADLLNRVISRSLQATEQAGRWRNALGPRLPRLLTSAGLTVLGCEGTCSVPDLSHPAILASSAQSLRLAAANALADHSITERDLTAAIRLIRNQEVNMVTPTLFGALARLPH
jgi:SAM-dependent methyltransferase